ncbi:MAG: hypothetical protein Q4A61_03630 [Porphyromonadaceae bacterium]|nr:hypothetical protein [Porphyromonadaceae bacterium]
MKKILVLVLALGCLTACSKTGQEPAPAPPVQETPSNPDPQKPQKPDPEKPNVPELHYISKIEFLDEQQRVHHMVQYSYDEAMRLSSLEEHYSRGTNVDVYTGGTNVDVYTGKLSYEAASVLMTYDNDKHQKNLVKPTEYRLFLDEASKRATKLEETIFFEGSEPEVRREADNTFDDFGRRTSYISPFMRLVSLTWRENNLEKVLYERDEFSVTEMRAYSQVKNNVYPDLNFLQRRLLFAPEYQYLWTEQLGIRSHHLMSRLERSSKERADLNRQITYKYDLDAKGRPIRITIQNEGDVSVIVLTYVER